eukprot:TRINITY_DN3805_c0_g1_i6.p1 TRINITY_DN3805_c0_g1~~TRINITY_DN3805_c0_g1_i6.p1  ORF type:complete len:862 (+),score=176.08 TRINITY_DN3805_c0_g1_i6:44-2629(+)
MSTKYVQRSQTPKKRERNVHHPTLFVSLDSYKLVDCADTLGIHVFGRSMYQFIRSFSRKQRFLFTSGWILPATISIMEFVQVQTFSISWTAPILLVGAFVPFYVTCNTARDVMVNNLRNFETCFLLVNVSSNTLLMTSFFDGPDRILFHFLIYFTSYIFVLFLDITNAEFGFFEKKIRKAFQATNIFVENLVTDISSRNLTLHHFGILQMINRILKESHVLKDSSPRKALISPYSPTSHKAFAFGASVGLFYQISLLILAQLDHYALDSHMLIRTKWERWSIRDVLLFTSSNIVFFTCNRLYLMFTEPGSPVCYRRGLVRVPLTPHWLNLVKEKREFAKSKQTRLKDLSSANIANNSNDHNPVINPNRIEKSNSPSMPLSVILAKNMRFQRRPIVLSAEEISKRSIAAITCFFNKHVLYDSRDSLLLNYISSLGRRPVRIYRKFRRFTFFCWLMSFLLSPLVTLHRFDSVEFIFAFLSTFGLIDILFFLANVPKAIYIETFRSFEAMFIIGNSVALVVGLADFFMWQGVRVYFGFPYLLLSIWQTLFYDLVHIPWSSVINHLDTIRITDDFDTRMPFTASLLHRLDRYFVETGQLTPSTEQTFGINQVQDYSNVNTNACQESVLLGSHMSAQERRFYRKVMGYEGVIYYAAMLFIVIALYILVIGGQVFYTKERSIRFLIFEWRNVSLAKSAMLNLSIFATKRMYNNWTNPMVSTTLKATHQMIPLVRSLVDAMSCTATENHADQQQQQQENQPPIISDENNGNKDSEDSQMDNHDALVASEAFPSKPEIRSEIRSEIRPGDQVNSKSTDQQKEQKHKINIQESVAATYPLQSPNFLVIADQVDDVDIFVVDRDDHLPGQV